MDYTFHDPKVIQFLQNNPDLHLDHLLLALLPLIELINPQNNTVQINHVLYNFSKINENIANLQNNYTSQVDLLKSFVFNNNQTLLHSLHDTYIFCLRFTIVSIKIFRNNCFIYRLTKFTGLCVI